MERRRSQAAERADPALSCTVPEAPVETRGRGSEYPTEVRNTMDIAVAAFSGGVTRVMSLQLSYAFSHILHSWLGHTSDLHTMSHDGQDRRLVLGADRVPAREARLRERGRRHAARQHARRGG
ncbi:DUF1552 domain-containing protein [Sorangium sp. So ce1151]|uniref:DUF1552 domain-containing protein n=1 Tax=Sorangium sp. So ce1151 TaxID=3133332 RepID=UPI003F62308C